MTKQELENLKPGTLVRLIGTEHVGLFVQLNSFGLAEIDGPAEAFECCRTWDEIEPLVPQLRWTRDAPTSPGWYWLRGIAQADPARIAEVAWFEGNLTAFTAGVERPHLLDRFEYVEWFGPLEAPP